MHDTGGNAAVDVQEKEGEEMSIFSKQPETVEKKKNTTGKVRCKTCWEVFEVRTEVDNYWIICQKCKNK
jgi:hypothetical protein